MPRILIVGAGLTGLAVAYGLRKAGVPSLMLEAAPRAGGRIETFAFPDGTRAEAGMEEFWERSPALALLRELGLRLVADNAHVAVRLDGRIYAPSRALGGDGYLRALFDVGERDAFYRWNDATWALYRRLDPTAMHDAPLDVTLAPLAQVSLADFVQQQVPQRVAEWLRVNVEPEIGAAWTEISALDGLDEMRIFLDVDGGFGERNYHVAGGNSALVTALVDGSAPLADLWLNARVTRIEQTAHSVVVTYIRADGTQSTVEGSHAVVTTPLPALSGIAFDPPLDDVRRRAIASTSFGCYVKVTMRVERDAERLWAHHGPDLFTLLTDGPAGSLYDVVRLSGVDSVAQSQDLILTALVHGVHARALLGLTPDAVGNAVIGHVDALFPGFRRHVRDAVARVYPQGVACWRLVDRRSRFDALARALREPFGRVLIGGDTTDHSHSEGAIRAANRIIAALTQADVADFPNACG